ncbi:MAG: chemotaxis protein CheA [Lachnospiraceae bacterium]|nr:chemotaxis protein CheA [Lachnospiraceae bacterium]MCI9400201.1 chemotaxis protein CheA [Lachnospiraceae bacterium]MCX4375283.1 chemotaxis protein CheA [Lachnospiraceae bacterium]
MDTSQYLDIFLDETKEHLQNLNTQIMDLEQNPENMDTINEIFRAAHSLKGMAGTMGYKRMQTLTHDMENVFSEVRNGTFKVQPDMIDVLFRCLDALEEYVANIQQTTEEGTNDNEDLIKILNDILKNGGQVSAAGSESKTEEAPAPAQEAAPAASGKGPRWQTIKLNDTEKMLIEKAGKDGVNVYGITVYVEEACVLKAARAFLVFKALEKLGEIIVSVPPAQDIEDEKFDLTFSLIFISENTKEEVIGAIKSVSEIDEAFCEVYTVAEPPAPAQEKAEEKVADTKPSASEQKPAPATSAPASSNTKPTSKPANKPVVNRTVRVDIEKLDNLMNLVSELIIAKNSLVSATAADDSKGDSGSVNEQIEYLESVTTNLHESVMKVRMVPIESVVAKFPRMIRDLSKKLDKKMELYMTGEDTELDRTVVDEIGDPLMHMLRNSADHGLEPNDVRVANGKPEVGSIFLDAYQDGNNVVIEVRDDGGGINVEAVRNKAIERGTITPEQAESMTDKEIIDLLFLPSFSTAKKVSDVSGRGVGLDVVKSKIESLSGEVEVKNHFGQGSSWIIRLPLTLAIIQALMVVIGGEKYAIALGSIQTIEDVPPEDIKLVQAKEVMHIRGTVIPIIRMNKVLDIETTVDEKKNLTVIIVKKGDKQAGLVVDELIGQQEVVIKSMGKYIKVPKIISGATILGNGDVALILDANPLI